MGSTDILGCGLLSSLAMIISCCLAFVSLLCSFSQQRKWGSENSPKNTKSAFGNAVLSFVFQALPCPWSLNSVLKKIIYYSCSSIELDKRIEKLLLSCTVKKTCKATTNGLLSFSIARHITPKLKSGRCFIIESLGND